MFFTGQYNHLSQVIRRLITTLQQSGLTLTFLFDGALPHEKQDTRLKRYRSYVERSALTMQNLSPINASNKDPATAFLQEGPQYRNDLFMIPPLTLEVCIQTLRELSVSVYVCAGEADGVVAQLAEETQGYIVSKDTDMHIYPKSGKGYISLDSLAIPSFNGRGGVKKVITATVCRAQDLATLLGLKLDMLPLFGTLVGNDYVDFQTVKSPIMTWCSKNIPLQPQLQGYSQWHRCVAEFIRQMDQLSATTGSSIISTIVSELEPIILASGMTKKQDKVRTMEHIIGDSVQRYTFKDLPSAPSTQSSHSGYLTLDAHMAMQQYSRDLLDLTTTRTFWSGVFLEDMQRESSWYVSRPLRQAIYRWNDMGAIKEYIRERQHLTHQEIPPSNDPSITKLDKSDGSGRLKLFLHLHHISIPLMTSLDRQVPKPLQPLIICLRYFIQQSNASGNMLADHEVVAILIASLVDLVPAVLPDDFGDSDGPPSLTALATAITPPDDGDDDLKIPSLKKRSIQLTTEWQQTLLSSHLLAQVLLPRQQHLQQQGILTHCYNGLVMHMCLQMGRLGASMGRMMLGASTKWMALFGRLYELVIIPGQIEQVYDYKFTTKADKSAWMKSRILKKIESKDDVPTDHVKKIRKTKGGNGIKPKGNVFDVLSSGCHFDE